MSSPAKMGSEFEEVVRGTDTTPPVKAEPGADGGGGALINLKVQSQSAEDVFFRVKRNVKLRRLIDMYCGKHSVDPKAIVFLDPSGRHIRPEQTPDEVGLEDGDAIDVLIHQLGGGGAPAHASRASA